MRSEFAITLFASGGVLLVLDQWSKRMVQAHAANRCISCGRVLRIRYVKNPALANGRKARAALVLAWLAALASAIVLYRSGAWFQSYAALFGLGLAFGGAAGNIVDILRLRSIVDFIDLRWWPVFNLADVAIVAGLAAAFWPPT